MSDRMTSAQARQAADKACSYSATAAMRLREAADALEQYEAEAAARAGMPELPKPWAAVSEKYGLHYWDSATAERVRERVREWSHDAGWVKIVRLAVVEVAEPEPPRPVREVGSSGWSYERMGYGTAPYVEIRCRDGRSPGNAWRSDAVNVPDCDRALVARLLGEVG